jgi:NADH dehydrogenase
LPHVVIVGGGFGGLYAAKALHRAPVRITLIDRRNFHLFQPLLYQVATGGLSPADIAAPLRALLERQSNVRVLQAEVQDIDVDSREIVVDGDRIGYDHLILASGATHHYFGNDGWAESAPGLKTIEDATAIRAALLSAFERAERQGDTSPLTFAIVGGGPTGVELAGAIGELAHYTLKNDFRAVDPSNARIVLLEAADRLLLAYPERLSRRAAEALEGLGVDVRTQTKVSDIRDGTLTIEADGETTTLDASVVLWAAGVKASPLGKCLGAELDRAGRVVVDDDLTVPGHPEISVIGDLASLGLPGTAPVAMQQGRYVASAIRARLRGKGVDPFRYRDKGSLAVIGRARAVALLGRFGFWGYPAWLLWLFVHLMYLVAFENRVIVFIQWAWSYFTRNRRARLITEPHGD